VISFGISTGTGSSTGVFSAVNSCHDARVSGPTVSVH
jgi:hypothetical protein